MTATQKKSEPLTNNTKENNKKREEGRSLGLAETLPPTLVRNSSHYSALASQQTTSSIKS